MFLPSNMGDSGLGDIMVRAQWSYMCFLALIPVWDVCWSNHLAAYYNFVVSHCFVDDFGFVLSSFVHVGLCSLTVGHSFVGFPCVVSFACAALFDGIIPFFMICVVSVRGLFAGCSC